MDSPRARSAALSAALVTIAFGALAPAAGARTLYAGNYVSGSVSALTIGADGGLAPVAGSPFAAVPSTAGLAMSPDGSTLIALRNENPGALTAFTVGPGGALSAKSGSNPATGNFPSYSTIDPSGRFAYVSNGAGGMGSQVVSGFALAGSAMPVSLGAPFPGGGINLAGIASSVDGRFVYLGHNNGPNSVRGYSVGADGRLTALPGSPFNIGVSSAKSIAMSPDGRFAFVADVGSDKIVTAAIGADGAPIQVGAPVDAAGIDPSYLALTRDGRFLLSANTGAAGRGISVFAVAADGSLTLAPGSPTAVATLPTGLAVTPDGRRAYVMLQAASSNVLGFSIGTSGALNALPGSPYSSGGSNNDFAEQSLAIAPDLGPRAAIAAAVKGSTVTFNGAGSSDPDGSVAVYEWAFGDGKTATSATPEVEHTYAGAGTYAATLRVIDDEGCSAARVYTGVATLCSASPAAEAATTVTVAGPPAPNERPKVTGVKVTKKLAQGKLAGLTVGFRLSEAAAAKVAIQRKAAGRRAGKRCVKPKRANRRKAKCDRFVPVLNGSVRAGKAGTVTLKFGKKMVKRLKPGSYRVAITARDTTGKTTAKAATKGFKVAKPKPRRR